MVRPWTFLIISFDVNLKVKTLLWDIEFKPKKQTFECNKIGVISMISIQPVVPLRPYLYIFVLYHELYPAKEASSAIPFDRNEALSHQDFIVALQKMDLENSMEEANFLFQTNHLPLSFFRSASSETTAGQNRCKPGTSFTAAISGSCPSNDCSDISVPINPSLSPSGFSIFSPLSPSDSWTEQNKKDLEEFQASREHIISDPYAPSKSLCSNTSINDSFPSSGKSGCPLNSSSDQCLNPDCNEENYYVASDCSSENDTKISVPNPDTVCNRESRSFDHETVRNFMCESSRDFPTRVYKCDARFTSAEVLPLTDSSRTETDSFQSLPSVQFPLSAPISSSSISVHRVARRKSNLRAHAVNCEVNQSDNLTCVGEQNSTTSSCGSRELGSFFQGGSSSDSELECKSDRPRFSMNNIHRSACQSLKNINFLTHSPSLDSDDDPVNVHIQNQYKYDTNYDESQQCIFDNIDSLDYSDNFPRNQFRRDLMYDKSSTSTSSVAGISRRSERYIRDIDALELAGVPFSYEDVVYSTNEEFRELRSTSGLTDDQVTAMLDARRRATNRHAAERCRRLKIAVRDELAERLFQLRVQRQVLTRRLVKARQRRREARDSLTSEQNRLLCMLRDSNGCKLQPSDWRIRLTNDDEIIVVAVGH